VGLKSKPARHTSERLKIHKVYLCHLVNLYCFEDSILVLSYKVSVSEGKKV
jgi:hypothetical protein